MERFYKGRRNLGGKKLIAKPKYPKPSYPLIPYIRISVKPSYQGLGIIPAKPWFVNRVRNLFCPNFWEKFQKDRNTFKKV